MSAHSHIFMFLCSKFVHVTYLCLSHYNSAACSAIIVTSSSSYNTSAISLSVTLFPFLLSLSLKISLISKFSIRGVLLLISIWSFFYIISPVRFSVFSQCNKLITVILLLNKIMPFCSCYFEKELVYITITSLTKCQLFFCIKCMQANMYFSCNIHSIFDINFAFCIIICIFPILVVKTLSVVQHCWLFFALCKVYNFFV